MKRKISQKTAQIASGYVRRLKKDGLKIEKAIVFGSFAKGRQTKQSDIDLCVVSPDFRDALKAAQFLWKKRNIVETMAGLEPIGFSRKSFQEGGGLIEEIKATGVDLG